MSAFVSRVLVAAAGVPVVLAIVWLGGWWLFALATVAGLIALHEFYWVVRSLRPLVLAGYVGAILSLLGAQLGGVAWMLGGFLTTLALAFLLKGFADTRQPTTVSVGATVLGTGWIALGLGHLVLLRDLPDVDEARLVTFTLLIAVWAGDTVAYLAGRLFGRHKLAPVTSPGKTWEGLLGGTVATVLVTFFALYDDRDTFLTVPETLVLGGVIAAAAPLGDLFESLIKRDMGVKDSGSVLAAHGGMLDRLDALLFATIAAFYVLLAAGID
jgi:phosphatidate cytidylyltransferase